MVGRKWRGRRKYKPTVMGRNRYKNSIEEKSIYTSFDIYVSIFAWIRYEKNILSNFDLSARGTRGRGDAVLRFLKKAWQKLPRNFWLFSPQGFKIWWLNFDLSVCWGYAFFYRRGVLWTPVGERSSPLPSLCVAVVFAFVVYMSIYVN